MSVLAANSHVVVLNRGEVQHQSHSREHQFSSLLISKSSRLLGGDFEWRKKVKSVKRDFRVESFWPEMPKPQSSVSVVVMEPINDVQHLDQILLHSQQQSQPIIIDWMAAWCRKCIFLKPKLEKLATEFDSKVIFYCVDVNKVPQTLVKRGNISKMPTIQLWKDGEMKEEVIGGHKAWLVIEEVREMIQKFL